MSEESKDSARWANQQERGNYWAMRSLVLLYRYGGRWLAYPIVMLVVSYFFVSRADTRAHSRAYLERVAEYTDAFSKEDVNTFLVWRHYMSFGRALLNRFAAWMGRISLEDVIFKDRHILSKMQNSNTGSVILGAHFGNIEMCRAVVTRHKHLIMNVVVNHENAEKFNRLLQSTSSNVGVNVISTQSINIGTAVELRRKLERGESLVILADRVAEGSLRRFLPVEFLGAPTALPEGVFRLASRLECPVYFMTCMSSKAGFNMVFKELVADCSGEHRKQIIDLLAARYLDALTEACIESPLEWFNFYDFWAVGKQNN